MDQKTYLKEMAKHAQRNTTITKREDSNQKKIQIKTFKVEGEFERLIDSIDINSKYMQSGVTVDLGIMYIPSESLMQLIDSIDNIREQIFRDHRVLIMGPNSLAAYLISVHMGFRTLALNERASEIMKEFGKLKKEFENFGGSTEELQKKTDAMLKAVNEHATRERQMDKAIKNMDQLDS